MRFLKRVFRWCLWIAATCLVLLALIVASHMLHRSGVRVGTALSQPTTLRFEPSAYVSRQEIDATIAAAQTKATAFPLHGRLRPTISANVR